mmetsp:Transcript_136320/g.240947  ORF Transcript_136320/g.240947 Transcript_136320/m.240947 type:complete len:599 (+) Transcript_136320:181-1977(+)
MRTWFFAVLVSAFSAYSQAADPKAGLRGRHGLFQRSVGRDAVVSRLTLRGRTDMEHVAQKGESLTKSHSKGPEMPGFRDALSEMKGYYLGHNFDSSRLAVNPWDIILKRGINVVSELKPTAPFDRLDRRFTPSMTGAAPVPPGEDASSFNSQMPPDWNPPYKHNHLFPEDAAPHKDLAKGHEGEVPIGDRNVVTRADVLRNQNWMMDAFGSQDPYPLVAPGDRIRPGPYPRSIEDNVDQKYAKYFTQMAENERERVFHAAAVKDYHRVDSDNDNVLSWDEYRGELEGHQKKKEDEARYLWRKFHHGNTDSMSASEFKQLAVTGFDLGEDYVNRSVRSDVMGVLTFEKAPHIGFWGSGAACAPGSFVKGVQLKVKPTGAWDNTGVNALKFRCDDGKEVQTAEGPDGNWSDWAECLPGQRVFSVKARVQPFMTGQDNSGVNDLSFQCRSPDVVKNTRLLFSNNDQLTQVEEGYVLVDGSYVKASAATEAKAGIVRARGDVGLNGGWSEDQSCGTNGLLCGAMVRLMSDGVTKDNMGITDMRFMCCSKALDCSSVCQTTTQSTDCQACMAKARTKVGATLAAQPPVAAELTGAAPAPAAAS